MASMQGTSRANVIVIEDDDASRAKPRRKKSLPKPSDHVINLDEDSPIVLSDDDVNITTANTNVNDSAIRQFDVTPQVAETHSRHEQRKVKDPTILPRPSSASKKRTNSTNTQSQYAVPSPTHARPSLTLEDCDHAQSPRIRSPPSTTITSNADSTQSALSTLSKSGQTSIEDATLRIDRLHEDEMCDITRMANDSAEAARTTPKSHRKPPTTIPITAESPTRSLPEQVSTRKTISQEHNPTIVSVEESPIAARVAPESGNLIGESSQTTLRSRARPTTTNMEPETSTRVAQQHGQPATAAAKSNMEFPRSTGVVVPKCQPARMVKSVASLLQGGIRHRGTKTIPRPTIKDSQAQQGTRESPQHGKETRVPLPEPSPSQPTDSQMQKEPVVDQDPSNTDRQPNQSPKISVQVLNVHCVESTRAMVQDCLKKHLDERYESQSYSLTAAFLRQRTYSRERRTRPRPGMPSPTSLPSLPDKYQPKTSPFSDMEPIQNPTEKSAPQENLRYLTQEVFSKSRHKENVSRSIIRAPTTGYRSAAIHVPFFREYVILQDNILAENETKLLYYPSLQDESKEPELHEKLFEIYRVKNDPDQPQNDLRSDQYRFYKSSVEAFLEELGVAWQHILFWLLAPASEIKRINSTITGPETKEFEALLLNRLPHCQEDFNREKRKWKDFLSQLEQPSPPKLRLSALACSAFLEQCDFSLWHLARRSKVVEKYVLQTIKSPSTESNFTYRGSMCRVCHEHNCLFHGELREEAADSTVAESLDSEDSTNEDFDESPAVELGGSESGRINDASAKDQDSDEDSDIEKVINYKRLANLEAALESTMSLVRRPNPPKGKFNVDWWSKYTNTSTWEKRTPFYPCNHEGPCEQAQCRCFRENINCEKTCACSLSCIRRFPGCSCRNAPGKRLCGTEKCPCFKLNRECDADLCSTCGATEILDPVNRYNEDVGKDKCRNVAIQRNVPKKTLLGHSEVHGFGLYTGEDIAMDDFIGEYKGEIISQEEGLRREVNYTYQKSMYQFSLNKNQEIDATYLGNKTRFVNNASDKFTNCYVRNVLCNSVFRLAMYAKHDLKAGTELYFNYNYPAEIVAKFTQPKGKSSQPGKVVAYKKKKTKDLSSSSSCRPQSASSLPGKPAGRPKLIGRLSTPERRRQTENARAALAAKKAANLTSRLTQSSTATGHVSQRAKKSVPNIGLAHLPRRRYNRDENDEGQLQEEIQETDSEDNDLVPRGNQDTQTAREQKSDEYEVPVTDEEDSTVDGDAADPSDDNSSSRPSTRTRGRPRLTGKYSTIGSLTRARGGRRQGAGIRKTVRHGGVREGAGRKRKQPDD